ncbi:MAG: biopolymer transporter Tol [Ignavibacteria bacterium]|nr:biopolymer transporter Tol [Ignavibacteria bacterium]
MINRKFFFPLFWLFLLMLVPSYNAYSQFESHPDQDWFTIETEHFTVTFHKGAERTAQVIAKIAEEIYGPITSLYKYEPDSKVNFVVNDLSDIANGATDYYNNRIEIFASALDFELRGTHNWLRNVITHEYTHMIQIQASLKFSQNMPAIYFQLINYEKERRPDVLYGYPNVIVSYPISGVGVPAWFAEGTAQYQRQQLGYDFWDANRDMILRSYVLDNNMLSWNEMGQFSSITSLKAESIYNSGFALSQYISRVYGEDKLVKITESLGDLTNFSVDKAIREHIGKDGDELYEEWRNYMVKDYGDRTAEVKRTMIDGEILSPEGFANYFPEFSPDGKKVAFLTNGDYDYAMTGIVIYDLTSKNVTFIDAPVTSNFSFSPDGKKIIYAKRNAPPNIDETILFDIYEYDFAKEESFRLSEDLRAYSPVYSPDGSSVCYIHGTDGTLNIYLADNKLRKRKRLTDYKNGEQVYNPVFSADGKSVIFDYSLNDSRSILSINTETLKTEPLIETEGIDFRNPVLSKDGGKLYYSSNETGIFNIYSYDFNTKEKNQVTNVLGGAFMPDVDSKNNIVYSTYKSSGFKVSLIKNFIENKPENLGHYKTADRLVKKYADTLNTGKEKFDWNSLKNFNDKDIKYKDKKPYKSIFNQVSIFPLIRFDNYTKKNNVLDALKPGFYIYSDELMTRFSIFGGFAINRKGERDIFAQFTFDNGFPVAGDWFAKSLKFQPKFTLSGYNVTRKTDALLIAGLDEITVGVAYDLLEFELAMDFKMINYNHDFRLGFGLSKYASSIDEFVLPQSGIFVPASSQDYFKAERITLDYSYDETKRNRNMDINPFGRKINFRYEFEASRINPELVVDDQGNVQTGYQKNYLHKADLAWREGIETFKNHSLSLRLRAAAILKNEKVDTFYDLYASGLPGMRGYPYFALGGGRLASLNLTYRFPVLTRIDTRLSPFYLDKLYFSVFADWGNAWNGESIQVRELRKDIGAELRLQMFSSYVFPTSVFFSAAYGIDKFDKTYYGQKVTYGDEVLFYFGMLFGFDM